MNTLSPAFLSEVEEEAVEELEELVYDVLDSLIVEGSTYGDVELKSDEDFVMFYMDLLNHQLDPMLPPMNIVPYVEVVNPAMAEQWRQRFERTSGRLLGVR
jgi:hypothetical protein